MMDIDGKNARQLTSGEKGESSPAFSPDGNWISYLNPADGNLYAIPRHGRPTRKLVNISTGVSDPVWSPRRQVDRVFFGCVSRMRRRRRLQQEDRGDLVKGAAQSAHGRFASLSPLDRWKDGTRTHIFLANAATGEARDLTPGNFDSPTFQLGGPLQYDFSPDGKELVFVRITTSNRLRQPTMTCGWSRWPTPKPQPRNITAANPAYDGSPKYSPDGKVHRVSDAEAARL